MKRVLKWVVPADDQRHDIGGGAIVYIGHQGSVNEVVVWTEEDANAKVRTVEAQVFGTGHQYSDMGVALGSVVHLPQRRPYAKEPDLLSPLVWHLVVFPGA